MLYVRLSVCPPLIGELGSEGVHLKLLGSAGEAVQVVEPPAAMLAGEAEQESVLPSGRQAGPVQPAVTVTVAVAVAA